MRNLLFLILLVLSFPNSYSEELDIPLDDMILEAHDVIEWSLRPKFGCTDKADKNFMIGDQNGSLFDLVPPQRRVLFEDCSSANRLYSMNDRVGFRAVRRADVESARDYCICTHFKQKAYDDSCPNMPAIKKLYGWSCFSDLSNEIDEFIKGYKPDYSYFHFEKSKSDFPFDKKNLKFHILGYLAENKASLTCGDFSKIREADFISFVIKTIATPSGDLSHYSPDKMKDNYLLLLREELGKIGGSITFEKIEEAKKVASQKIIQRGKWYKLWNGDAITKDSLEHLNKLLVNPNNRSLLLNATKAMKTSKEDLSTMTSENENANRTHLLIAEIENSKISDINVDELNDLKELSDRKYDSWKRMYQTRLGLEKQAEEFKAKLPLIADKIKQTISELGTVEDWLNDQNNLLNVLRSLSILQPYMTDIEKAVGDKEKIEIILIATQEELKVSNDPNLKQAREALDNYFNKRKKAQELRLRLEKEHQEYLSTISKAFDAE
ncbi:MAG: hypothetical protein EP326_06775, partial [Deltaproteobacteria bacterium]